jgi:hypothetical protein
MLHDRKLDTPEGDGYKCRDCGFGVKNPEIINLRDLSDKSTGVSADLRQKTIKRMEFLKQKVREQQRSGFNESNNFLTKLQSKFIKEEKEIRTPLSEEKIIDILSGIFGWDKSYLDTRNHEDEIIPNPYSNLKGEKISWEIKDGDDFTVFYKITGIISKDYFERYYGDERDINRVKKELDAKMYSYSGPGSNYTHGSINIKPTMNGYAFDIHIEKGLDIFFII